MILETERKKVVEYGKKLIESGLTTGTGGNISIYNSNEKLVAVSPSGMDYFETAAEDVVVIDLEGSIVDGDKKPSSEISMHLINYQKAKKINAVVHTHSTYSTILATLGWNLPAANYFIAIAGGKDVRCARYATFGTQELAKEAFEAMKDRNACFLANHGLLTRAHSIEQAFSIAEETERMAEIYYKCKCVGDPMILSDQEVDVMLEKFKTYGQK